MPPMTNQQIKDFLAGDAHLMKLATLTSEGWPYVNPVWYHYTNEAFLIAGRRKAAWVNHIRHDTRVSACIDTHISPYTRVLIEGSAEIVDERWMGDWEHWAIRYLGCQMGRKYYADTRHIPRILLRITSRKTTSWSGPGWHQRYSESHQDILPPKR